MSASERLIRGRMPVVVFVNTAANDEFFMISCGSNPVGIYHGEFDPGSEQTLAACLKHASRAARAAMPLERRTGE